MDKSENHRDKAKEIYKRLKNRRTLSDAELLSTLDSLMKVAQDEITLRFLQHFKCNDLLVRLLSSELDEEILDKISGTISLIFFDLFNFKRQFLLFVVELVNFNLISKINKFVASTAIVKQFEFPSFTISIREPSFAEADLGWKTWWSAIIMAR